MSESWEKIEVGQRFSVNPQRQIQRGTVTPFVPMDALSTNARKFERIDEREFKGSGQKFINGDTLIARITPCLENGKTAYVSGLSEGKVGHGSTEYIVLTGIEGTSDNLFAYYLARTPKFRTYAIGRMEGTSGRQRVPATAISSYGIGLPPLAEQKAIASVLGALDDKIENNLRMNETLEEMARAIFKSWFVDFDPVHAKAAGNAPAHMDADTAALFPSSFGDDGLPLGWTLTTFGDVCTIKSGKRPPTKLTSPNDENNISVYGGNGIAWYTNEILFEQPFIITGRVGTLGTVYRVYEECWVSDNALCCFPGSEDVFELIYFAMKEVDYHSLNSGSTQPLLTQTTLKNQSIIAPSEPEVAAFHRSVKVLFKKILTNDEESQNLAEIRDTLLPKLMSGEIRVADAEREVEAAV